MSEAIREISGRQIRAEAPTTDAARDALVELADRLTEARAMNRRGESWSENVRDVATEIAKEADRAGVRIRFTVR